MRFAVKNGLFMLGLLAGVIILSNAQAQQELTARIPVFVSILPQAYFVERIGGDLVDVDVLVGPGQSPATYEPTPQQMARLSNAELYFTIGVPFEAHLLRRIGATLSKLRVVETEKAVFGTMRFDEAPEREPDTGEVHNHGDLDPHIWLDPELVKLLAESICDGLVLFDPEHRRYYENNLVAFQADLDSVDARISGRLTPLTRRDFYVFHPAFGHFARAYGLRQVAIEKEGKEPSARQLADLISRAEKEQVKVIIVQKQFSTSAAEAIAESIGARVVQLDPLARDYLTNIENIAEVLAEALKE